jgi:4,5-DOPA dioxygenase extradiol
MEHPATIHDFGGFPRALHEMQYPAPGDPALARRVAELLSPAPVHQDLEWGLDHGCWSVLHHAYPHADVPVVQVSLDLGKSPAQHLETGRRLRRLRDEGVLLMGTGNIVHNLSTLIRDDATPPFDWAERFSARTREAIAEDRPDDVVAFQAMGTDARLAAPTPEHFWPLLYILGARCPDDRAVFGPDQIQYGSVDMTTLVLQPAA